MGDDYVTSYTHQNEDILLRRALVGVKHGFYIDVGAYHPENDSVTKLFYDSGWTGINLEPNPKFFQQLVVERQRDINLDCAVGDRTGSVRLAILGETGLSTLVEEVAAGHVRAGEDRREIEVRQTTLKAIWDTHVPDGTPVHFLKIDVEGAEEQVIRGADWIAHRPWIVVVEATLPNSTVMSHTAWEPVLLEAGYLYAYFDGLNRYYVAPERAELKDAFDRPASVVFDRFIPYMAHLYAKDHDATKQQLQASEKQLQRARSELDASYLRLEQARVDRYRADTRAEEATAQAKLAMRRLATERELRKRQPRPLWQQVMFRSSGKPKRLFRKLLFHTSGKPRRMFRTWILKADGRPRAVFHDWISSRSYQKRHKAVRVPQLDNLAKAERRKCPPAVDVHSPNLSARGKAMRELLELALQAEGAGR